MQPLISNEPRRLFSRGAADDLVNILSIDAEDDWTYVAEPIDGGDKFHVAVVDACGYVVGYF
jgi:hypothetical protein